MWVFLVAVIASALFSFSYFLLCRRRILPDNNPLTRRLPCVGSASLAWIYMFNFKWFNNHIIRHVRRIICVVLAYLCHTIRMAEMPRIAFLYMTLRKCLLYSPGLLTQYTLRIMVTWYVTHNIFLYIRQSNDPIWLCNHPVLYTGHSADGKKIEFFCHYLSIQSRWHLNHTHSDRACARFYIEYDYVYFVWVDLLPKQSYSFFSISRSKISSE